MGILSYILIRNQSIFISASQNAASSKINSLNVIGISLMSEYVLVFEVVGILLLMALIGAAFIAGKKA